MTAKEKISIALKWSARIISILMVCMFAVFFIGEGVDFAALTRNEIIMFVCVGAMLLGLLVSLVRSIPGALLTLCGYVGFLLMNQSLLLDTPFVAFAIIVCLYFVSWFLGRKTGLRLPA